MNPDVPIRPVIRETMQLAPARRWTVKALRAQLLAEHPDITEADVTTALLWNQSKGYVDYTYDSERETDYWQLTERGKKTPV